MMKISHFNFLIPILLLSCSTDNFYETDRYFETPKSTYKVGDEFNLTVVIESETEKTIRFYKNFRNLTVWTSLRKHCEDDSTQWCNEGGQAQNSGREKVTNILTYTISKENPFRKSFKCKIEEIDGRIIFSIPELEYYSNFDVKEFDGKTKLGIHGHCDPINPEFGTSLEEYINLKEIEIIHESINHIKKASIRDFFYRKWSG